MMRGFPGSTRLLEIAHTIEELKTICACGRKAICNGRKVNGEFVFEGAQVAIDTVDDVEYQSLCPPVLVPRVPRISGTASQKVNILR